jgi:predicted phage-related endonuclease
MRDHELSKLGIGGSDIAAIFGQDEYRDAFSVWAEKKGQLARPEPDPMMIVGKCLERGIAELYTHVTGRHIDWIDRTFVHHKYEWMRYTPDALVIGEKRGLDCKVIHWSQRRKWGADASDIPARVVMQAYWYMAALDFDLWDIAAFLGDLPRIYTIERNPEAERAMLDGAYQFYRRFIQGNETPPIQGPAAKAWLNRTFPIPRANLREADVEEIALMQEYAAIRAELHRVAQEKGRVENELKLCVGDHEGIYWEGGKFTWKLRRESKGVDWHSLAEALLCKQFQTEEEREALRKEYVRVTRPASRAIRFEWDGLELSEANYGIE